MKHQKQSEYQTCIKLTVTTDKQNRSVSGTLFAGKPRIVEVKGIEIDAGLSAHNLYISNEDKPGFITSDEASFNSTSLTVSKGTKSQCVSFIANTDNALKERQEFLYFDIQNVINAASGRNVPIRLTVEDW